MPIKLPSDYSTDFDFGFTAVDKEELPQPKVTPPPEPAPQISIDPILDKLHSLVIAQNDISERLDNIENIFSASKSDGFDVDQYKELIAKEVRDKLLQVEKLILPLLVNLKKNPEKEYIKWPNRVAAIDSQIEKILAITRSSGV